MTTSKEIRHDIYELLQSFGLEMDSIKKGQIKDLLLKHTDQKIVELALELTGAQKAIADRNSLLGRYRAKYGGLHDEKSRGANIQNKTHSNKTAEPKHFASQEITQAVLEESSSFTIPKEFRTIENKKFNRRTYG